MTSMSVRQFYWRDLPKLVRYRHQGLFFDNALVLTRGPVLVPVGALISYLATATGIFTYLCDNDEKPDCPLIGQITHGNGMPFARLVFLAPDAGLELNVLPALIEQSLRDIGERGAQHLLAEVEEQAIAFESLRKGRLRYLFPAADLAFECGSCGREATLSVARGGARGYDFCSFLVFQPGSRHGSTNRTASEAPIGRLGVS